MSLVNLRFMLLSSAVLVIPAVFAQSNSPPPIMLPGCTQYGDYPAATYGQYSNAPAPVLQPLTLKNDCQSLTVNNTIVAAGTTLQAISLSFTQYDYRNTVPGSNAPSSYLRDGCEWDPVPPAGSEQITGSLPLIVFLHPSTATPDIPNGIDPPWATPTLLQYINSPDLLKQGQPGFVLLAPQGRVTYHFFASDTLYGSNLVYTDLITGLPMVNQLNYWDAGLDVIDTGWDIWDRNVRSSGVTAGTASPDSILDPLANLDMVAIDSFIAQELAKTVKIKQNRKSVTFPKIDPSRVYVVGWSNGGSMAFLYGLNRSTVAAIGVYSGPNPYESHNDPCEQDPVTSAWRTPTPTSQVPQPNPANLSPAAPAVLMLSPKTPIYHLHNYCDINGTAPNIVNFESQLAQAGNSKLVDVNLQWNQAPPNPTQTQVTSGTYDTTCGSEINGGGPYTDPDVTLNGASSGLWNHIHWPDDWMIHLDGSGNDDGTGLFAFLKSHPLK